MTRIVPLLVGIAAGVTLGLILTAAALHSDPPFGALRSGPWTAWPSAGTAFADPYERAIALRDGRIPLAAAAGLRFIARNDSSGAALDGRCSYLLAGASPVAENWTVTVLDPHGASRPSPDGRAGITSSELVRASDGSFAIAVAPWARPGNWVPTRGPGSFLLVLNLYDTPLGTGPATEAASPALPSVTRGVCS